MSMDKEQLFIYFQNNYLPRNEVLFKLPFSVSIENFWAELLDRRKSRATFLPLRNGNGVPYWYTMTDKMINASEKLCEWALSQPDVAPQLTAQMTAAMTEEMFFTSFVEGAQIQFDDTMDFLQSEREPEDIHEQMVWNNREAWSAMMKTLYRPLDESYIKHLAYLLTIDMEGQANDYRQTDSHPIPAMGDSSYTVPSAFSLPERMREFYAFLRQTDIHPLIKASASQAFILVTRPFSEGNERLSRMVSSAVLLRSGYNYFRDISISSAIARDGRRYYKTMSDIIRSENGGDLTYFIEYYLVLLTWAVEDRAERKRLQEQKQASEDEKRKTIEQEKTLAAERQMSHTPLIQVANTPEASSPGHPAETIYDDDIDDPLHPLPDPPDAHIPREDPTEGIITAESSNKRIYAQRRDAFLAQLRNKGLVTFTLDDLQNATGLSKKSTRNACYGLAQRNLIAIDGKNKSLFHLLPLEDDSSESAIPTPVLPTSTHLSPLEHRLIEMGKPTSTDRDQRISAFLLDRIQRHQLSFVYRDWDKVYPLGRNVVRADLLHAVSMGLVTREPTHGGSMGGYCYIISTEYREDGRGRLVLDGLTEMQRGYITALFESFGNNEFNRKEAANVLNTNTSSLTFHFRNLIDRGILLGEKIGTTHVCKIQVSPEMNPECFISPEERRQQERISLPATASEIGCSTPADYVATAMCKEASL